MATENFNAAAENTAQKKGGDNTINIAAEDVAQKKIAENFINSANSIYKLCKPQGTPGCPEPRHF